jgi:hypothetical protein
LCVEVDRDMQQAYEMTVMCLLFYM